MGDIVKNIFSSFSEVIGGLTDGLKTAFENLIYADPTAAEPVLSPLAQFGFIFMGISMAVGIGYMIFKLIKR